MVRVGVHIRFYFQVKGYLSSNLYLDGIVNTLICILRIVKTGKKTGCFINCSYAGNILVSLFLAHSGKRYKYY